VDLLAAALGERGVRRQSLAQPARGRLLRARDDEGGEAPQRFLGFVDAIARVDGLGADLALQHGPRAVDDGAAPRHLNPIRARAVGRGGDAQRGFRGLDGEHEDEEDE